MNSRREKRNNLRIEYISRLHYEQVKIITNIKIFKKNK